MDSNTRREKILGMLKKAEDPMKATALAKTFGVSRQIVVGDIALLRASGVDITATPRGYLLQLGHPSGQVVRKIACRHHVQDTVTELYTIVDGGGSVLDVIVEHPVYGQLCGELHIHSRYDADDFMRKIRQHDAPLLSNLTDGVHLHTLACPNEETCQRILAALREKSLLYEPI